MSRTTIFLCLLVSACASQTSGRVPNTASSAEAPGFLRFELIPERPPSADELLWLEVHVGALSAASTMIIRDGQGEQLGAIAPYGKSVRDAGGSHLVPLPASMQSGPINLSVELALAHHHTRQPTVEELKELRLVYLPVSP